MDKDNAGGLLGFLEDETFAAIGQELEMAGRLDGAKTAIEDFDYGAEELVELVAAIYDRFVTTADGNLTRVVCSRRSCPTSTICDRSWRSSTSANRG